jgi:hypothetical protein
MEASKNINVNGYDLSILYDRQLADRIFDIIKESTKYCFIVSPFLDIQYWDHLTRCLQEASNAKKKIVELF